MKFASYERAVTPNTISPPPLRVSGDINAYGGGGDGLGSIAGAIGQINKVAVKVQDDRDAADVMKARNEMLNSMMVKLYGDDGIFTTGVGENAQGMAERTREAVNQTFDEVGKKYNGRVRYALQSNLNENMANFMRSAYTQEAREREATEKADYASNLTLTEDLAGKTYNVPGALENALKDTRTLTYAWGARQGMTGAAIQAEERKNVTSIVGAAVGAAIEAEDYDTASKYLDTYRTSMDYATYLKLNKNVKGYKDAKLIDTEARDLVDKYWDPDTGTFNIKAALKDVDDRYGPNATKTIAGGVPGVFQGITPVDLPIEDSTGSDGMTMREQVENLGAGWKDALPLVGGALASLGLSGSVITSGGRTAAHQAEVNPSSPNSYHVIRENGGDAVDIALPDGISDEQAEEVRAYFENSGAFKEVLYHDAGTGYHLHLGGLNADVLKGGAPSSGNANYDQWMSEAAKEYGVPQNILYGLYKQESGFNPDAVSSQGAVGIAQFDPNTANERGVDPYDAHSSILGGAAYLRELYDEFGTWDKAIAAYNAGPKALRDNGGEIPDWAETKNHVRKVNEYAAEGGGMTTTSAYNPEKAQKLTNMIEARAADLQRAYKQDKEQRLESTVEAMRAAGSEGGAQSILDQSGFTGSDYLWLEGKKSSIYPKSSRSGGGSVRSGGTSSGGLTQSKVDSSADKIRTMAYNLSAGKGVGTSAFVAAYRAGNLLDDNDLLSDAALGDLRSMYQSQSFMSDLTDIIENSGINAAYKHITDGLTGLSEDETRLVAGIIMTKIDPVYLSKDYQGGWEDEEGEE